MSLRPPIVSRLFAVCLVAALLLVGMPTQRVYAVEEPPTTVSEAVAVEEAAPADAPARSADDGWAVSDLLEPDGAFSMVGVKGRRGTEVQVRVLAGDAWSGWMGVEQLDELDGPDEGSAEHRETERRRGDRWVGEPLWVGDADALQVRARGGRELDDVDLTVIDSMGLRETLLQRTARKARSLTTAPPADAAVRPAIVTRAQWGANESWRRGSPSYATPRFSVLHHTAGGNGYTRQEAPGVVRGIYHWHVNGNGWNDIGYNFLVDRYGTIYEGRFGGMDRGVVGAHAANWNSGSFGVAIMGNFEVANVPTVAVNAATDVIAWKYHLHGINPSTSATVTHNGRTVPTLIGHRDVGQTTCPGRFLVAQMNTMRQRIQVLATPDRSGWTPVSGDWTGDGVTNVGWFRAGRWRLVLGNAERAQVLEFTYGRSGDVPVVGDWNGNGQSTVGIIRDGEWHLRNTLSGGTGQIVFRYGRITQGDVPVVGDWNGNGLDTAGIIRDGDWHLRNSLSSGPGEIVFRYGRITQGDVPIVGDWNRNGRDTVGIIRDGQWHLRNSLSGGPADQVVNFGRLSNGDRPVAGDWTADGRTTIGVVRGATWYLRNALAGGAADVQFYAP